MTRFIGNPLKGIAFANAGDEAISVRLDGDNFARVRIDAGGRITWSSGSISGDTVLYRDSANLLKTDDAFQAAGGVITLTTTGAPTATLADGAIAVDTSNDAFYFRSNSTWQQVSGGGASVTVSDTAPASPDEGDLWYESDTGDIYVYYDGVWVDVGGASVANIAMSDTAPSNPVNGDFWFETDTARTFVYYDDGTSTQWVEVGAASASLPIGDLSDVTITSAADGELLIYNGTEWVNSTLPTSEPMGHEDSTASTISFDSGSLTFTIEPVGASHTVWCAGKRYVKTTAETVTIPNTAGLYYISYDATGALQYELTFFTWHEDTPTAYLYWNGSDYLLFDERHGIALDWATHEYLHRTRGAVLATGFGASNYTTTGTGDLDSEVQIDIANGTFFDEDLQVDITHSATPTANTWEQVLQGAAEIPIIYLSGTTWTFDTATEFPLKQGTALPKYNLDTAGTWSTPDLGNGSFGVTWIVATNILDTPIIGILGQDDYNNIGQAEAAEWSSQYLEGFPVVELRPLYKVVYEAKTSYTNTPAAAIRGVYDLRRYGSVAGEIPALPVADHGSLTGLADDDHTQYFNIARHDAHDHSTAMSSVVLDDVSNVDAASPTSGDFLKFDGSNWIPDQIPEINTLNDVGNVTITSATSGDFLKWDGSAWINSPINLGTDTVGNYVASLVAGTGVTLTNNSGEGATPTIEIGQDVGTTANVTFNDVTISGNLTVSGSTTTVNTATLSVEDPLIILASGNDTTDVVDIGFYGLYDTSGSQDLYAGLFRDATDGKFRLFTDSQTAPTTTVDTTATGYTIASLVANIEGTVTGALVGDLYASNGTSKVLENGTDGTDAVFTGDVAGDVTGTVSDISNHNLGDLGDVNFTIVTPAEGDIAYYDGAEWINYPLTFSNNGGVDLTTTTPTSGDFLKYDGTNWVPDAIDLGTDTIGDYVQSLVAGTGVTVSNNTGEGATPTVEIGQAVGTTDDVTFNTVTGTNGVVTLTSSGAPTASATDGTLAVDTANNVLYIRSGGAWVEASGGASLTVSETDPSSPDEGDIWFESDTGSTYVYFDSVWVEIGASSGAVITDVSENEPANPVNGHIWFDSSTGRTYVYYEDGTSNQWVEVGATSPTASGADGYVQFAESGGLASSSNLSWNDSTNALSVTGTVSASSGLITATSSGTPTASLDDGALVLDTVNEVLYVRSNGAWIEASGGASVTVSDGTPSGPDTGDLWYESDTGSMFVYYDSSWVEVGGAGVVAMTTSSAAPSGATNGDLWFDTDTAKTYVYYDDGTSTQWIEVGAASSGASGTDGSIQFATGGTFDSSASLVWDDVNSELEIEGHIIPGTTETYDLGSATNRFRDLYLSGTSINLGGVEISSDGTNLTLPPVANITGDFTVDTDTLHVDSTNNRVGIGTTTPSTNLHISSGTSGDAELRISADTDNNNESDLPYLSFTADGGIIEGVVGLNDNTLAISNSATSAAGIDLRTAGTNTYTTAADQVASTTSRLFINSSGNVGIGTTTPSTILDINKSGDPVVRVTGTDDDDTATLQLLEATTDPATFGLEIKYDGNVNITKIGHYDASTTVRTDIQITRAGGYVTMPNQPAFDVTRSAGLTSNNNVIYNTVNLNNGSHYSTANGRFTAPVTGRYFFYWTNIGLNSSGDVHRYYLRVNGSNTNKQLRLDQTTVGEAYQQATQNGILSLSAGDYVNVYYTSDSGSNSYGNNAYTRFGGYLLG